MDTTAHRAPSRKRGDRVFKTKSCELPRLRDLRLELGYGIRGQAQDIAFKKAVRAQVEGFVSSDNIPGLRFTKWKTPEHQRGLLEMTKDFLDIKGKGIEFWPDESSSPNKRPLEYSRDSVKIKRLMTKVFFREVKEYKRKPSPKSTIHEPTQAFSNSAIKKDDPPNQKDGRPSQSDKPPQDPRGQSVDNPIDVENMGPTPGFPEPSTDPDPFAGFGMTYSFGHFMYNEVLPDGLPATQDPFGTVRFELPGDVQSNVPNVENRNETPNLVAGNTPATDPYEVPTTPNGGTPVDQDRGKRPAQADPSENSDRTKVPRRELDAPVGQANQAANNSSAPGQKKKRRARQTLEKTRFSIRERKQTLRPGFAREKTVEAAMRTQISSDEDSDAEPPQQRRRRKNGPVPKGTIRRGKPPVPAPQQTICRTAGEQPTQPNHPEAQPSGDRPSTQERPGGAESQAGPSTGNHPEQQLNDGNASTTSARQGTNGAPVEGTGAERDSDERPAGSMELRDQEREAIATSSFTFFKSHDGIDFLDWTPTGSFFQMSLSHLAGELALGSNYSGLNMRLVTPDHSWQQDAQLDNENKFALIKHRFVRKIRNAHQSAFVASTNVPMLDFEVHIWPQRA